MNINKVLLFLILVSTCKLSYAAAFAVEESKIKEGRMSSQGTVGKTSTEAFTKVYEEAFVKAKAEGREDDAAGAIASAYTEAFIEVLKSAAMDTANRGIKMGLSTAEILEFTNNLLTAAEIDALRPATGK
jgi:hypothetical protein